MTENTLVRQFDDRESHAMEQRAFQLGFQLQQLQPYERLAITKPYPQKIEGKAEWVFTWDIYILRRPEHTPPPHKHAWEIYGRIA